MLSRGRGIVQWTSTQQQTLGLCFGYVDHLALSTDLTSETIVAKHFKKSQLSATFNKGEKGQ